VIEIENLTVRYGERLAVDSVSLAARSGAITGLLGPNGAGKTTTVGCLCGLVRPQAGSVRILGVDALADGARARRALGLAPQELALYDDLSARENLEYFGALYGLTGAKLRARASAVLEEIGLADRARERVSAFSGGMKRRLNLGCALVHEPAVLLLDEPTVGVDPQSRVHLLDLVRRMAREGTCVLYTTHYMEEAESLCDELAILDQGKVLASGSLEELRARVGERDLVRLAGAFDVERCRAALAVSNEVEIVAATAAELSLGVRDAPRRLAAILSALADAGAEVRETTLTRARLESLFIRLTGKELRE
jgi:ABC-2 type transport system ATP-binding protein